MKANKRQEKGANILGGDDKKGKRELVNKKKTEEWRGITPVSTTKSWSQVKLVSAAVAASDKYKPPPLHTLD